MSRIIEKFEREDEALKWGKDEYEMEAYANEGPVFSIHEYWAGDRRYYLACRPEDLENFVLFYIDNPHAKSDPGNPRLPVTIRWQLIDPNGRTFYMGAMITELYSVIRVDGEWYRSV